MVGNLSTRIERVALCFYCSMTDMIISTTSIQKNETLVLSFFKLFYISIKFTDKSINIYNSTKVYYGNIFHGNIYINLVKLLYGLT